MVNTMKPAITLILTAAFALGIPLADAADKVSTVPVQFAKGTSSFSTTHNLRGYDSVNYTLNAKASQSMRVSLTGSSNVGFNIYAPGDVPGVATALGNGSVGQEWNGVLPDSGTYTVQVYQVRAAARRGQQAAYGISFAIH